MTDRRRRVLADVDPRRVNYGSLAFDGEAAWAPEEPMRVPERFRSCIADDWLSDAPDAFDTAHRATGRLVVTNHGVSPTILAPTIAYDDLGRSVPMGYTTLAIVEKRAVVTEGRLARLWTAEFEPTAATSWRLLVPDDDRVVSIGWGLADPSGRDIGRVLGYAFSISRLMHGRSLLVTRQLESHDWH